MTSQFAVTLTLAVSGADRAAHVDGVVDRYATLEAADDRLLDCAWGLDEGDGTVDVSVTVLAADEREAYALATSSVCAAIHDAGGATPGWDAGTEDAAAVTYRLTDEAVAIV